jgi:hypothetical protein
LLGVFGLALAALEDLLQIAGAPVTALRRSIRSSIGSVERRRLRDDAFAARPTRGGSEHGGAEKAEDEDGTRRAGSLHRFSQKTMTWVSG